MHGETIKYICYYLKFVFIYLLVCYLLIIFIEVQ